MHTSSPRPTHHPLMALLRRIYRPVGFTKGYSFALWLIFGGGFFAFTLSRFMYLDFDGVLCPSKPRDDRPGGSQGAVPGECYYFQRAAGKAGIIMHLAGILPASVLAVLQFVPVIRHKALILHRINGYIVLLLSTVGMAGVFMIAKDSFGGTLDMQAATGASSIIFILCMVLGYYNIKRLQLEQHRAWMLRGWTVAGFILTMRVISIIMATITSKTEPYYSVTPCSVLDFMFRRNQSTVEALYPDCASFYTGEFPDQRVIVRGEFGGDRPDRTAAGLNTSFGAGAWLALLLHCVAAEIYIHLTPAEAERLRRISYRRQLQAGMKDPGNAGLTVQKLGDAEPWSCPDDNTSFYSGGGAVDGRRPASSDDLPPEKP
ncbi:hypothetical protein FZEAL_6568 [Fusarium zealandicum]|uniref:Microtubule associated protein n=1 Tax=Fusarium zealandicum TaxID=1053134 RepID=A0A8H4XIP6_9HYPO|nr:hypothetical protein FZEAL_6568 [Fusarium zealandicum]